MIAFLIVSPVLLPFFLLFITGNRLPGRLDWWKSFAAGIWSYLLYLLIAWAIAIPAAMVPSFLKDFLFWGIKMFLSLGITSVAGMYLFRSQFFSRFLNNTTIFAFMSGLYVPLGIDGLVRFAAMRDPFVLFALPLLDLFFILTLCFLAKKRLETTGSGQLIFPLLIIPVSFLFAFVPALFYSFYWWGALVLFLAAGAAGLLLALKENCIA